MDTKLKLSVAFALALLFGGKVFGQEWDYTIDLRWLDPMMTRQYCAYEMSDGRVIVSASFLYNDGSGHPFYPPHNALIALSPDGEELAKKDYFRDGYWGSSYNPYVFENEVGELFMLTTYSPDHNKAYFNYFQNLDDPPTDAILGLYKLDDHLEVVESYEYSFPIDTAQSPDVFGWCESSGGLHLHSAILDGGDMVGAYTKSVSLDRDSIHGYDSLFFFRMSFDGELLANVGYQLDASGVAWQMAFWREQLVSTDDGYIYYDYIPDVPPAPDGFDKPNDYAGTVAYLDKDLNLLRTRKLVHPGGNYSGWSGPFHFMDLSVMRSKHNTTYLATRSNRHYDPNYDDCYLYEFDDDIHGEQDVVPIIHDLERGVKNFDFVAECRAVEVGGDGSVFFCYSLNVGMWYDDSWVVMERLDEEFNTLSTVYYGTDSDRICYVAESITMSRDGDIFLTVENRDLDDRSRIGSSVVKFPAKAFVGIEEAHANGLKVAIAYPNPGNNMLNIRTGLKNARVEVYDTNGRLLHSQAITENVTAIDATDWAEGVYVWKVYTGDKEAETGRWIKQW